MLFLNVSLWLYFNSFYLKSKVLELLKNDIKQKIKDYHKKPCQREMDAQDRKTSVQIKKGRKVYAGIGIDCAACTALMDLWKKQEHCSHKMKTWSTVNTDESVKDSGFIGVLLHTWPHELICL